MKNHRTERPEKRPLKNKENESIVHGRSQIENNKCKSRLRPRSERRELRRWQMKAKRRFFALLDHQREQLITATPGSGKSLVTGEIGREMFETGRIERIVVVVPTEQLKMQWARVFDRFGIDLDPNWSNASYREASDYLGVIVTYQQVSSEPLIYDYNCRESKTFVIFDEIHPAGDGLDWGDKLRLAFGNAAFILSLSGTPFRHDGHPIPFVYYQSNKSRADFSYSYGEALADGVCRPIYFPAYEGSATWFDGRGALQERQMFYDSSRTEASQLLNALLDPEGDWLRSVLKEADDKLAEFRLDGHPAAGGLVIARDQFHARRIQKLLKTICGENPVVVISDEAEEAARRLKEFSKDECPRRWIVAVRMVSEGIDIPRLRVGVYATNILSELFFRQAVGRFVRVMPGLDEQSAAFYLPAHPALIRHALSIKEEREHFLPHAKSRLAEKNGFANTIEETGIGGHETEAVKDNDEVGTGGEVRVVGSALLTENTIDPSENAGDFPFDNENILTDETDNNPVSKNFSDGGGDPISHDAFNNALIGGDPSVIRRQVIVTVQSEARFHETIFDGLRFSDTELKKAETISREIGARIPPEQVAAIIRRAFETDRNDNPMNFSNAEKKERDLTFGNYSDQKNKLFAAGGGILTERKKQIRQLSNRLVNKLANRLKVAPDIIHRKWIQNHGGVPNDKATFEELNKKLEWVRAELNRTS